MSKGDLGVDYAWQHPDPATIAAAGYRFVFRYLSADPSKDITPAEARALLAAGLDIGLVWETTADRALSGAAGGVADGQTAAAQARPLPHGPGAVIVANIGDFKATPEQVATVRAYYEAFAAQIRGAGWTPGGYGTGWILLQLAAAGSVGVWWQNAMDNQSQKGSEVVACAHIYQRVKSTRPLAGSFDENVIVTDAPVPFWTANPGPAPTPAPAPTEDDTVTKDDIKAIAAEVMVELRQLEAPDGELFGRMRQAVNASIEAERPAEVAAVAQAVEQAVEQYMGGNGRKMFAEMINQILDARKLGVTP